MFLHGSTVSSILSLTYFTLNNISKNLDLIDYLVKMIAIITILP